MNDTAMTGLYLFSSLLQADAAILGFGAIFFIYKLQSLDSRCNLAMGLCAGSAGLDVDSRLLLIHQDARRLASILDKYAGQPVARELKFLVTIPVRAARIKEQVKLPIWSVVLHASLCAILLWLTPVLDKDYGLSPFVWIMIVGFVVVLGLSGAVAVGLVSKNDELSLKANRPEVHAIIFPEGRKDAFTFLD